MQAIQVIVPLPMDAAEGVVRAALAEQGFGVLTEFDLAATFKAKLGVDWTPLKVLGACNPTVAHRAMSIDPSVSLLLPCNVTLQPADGGTRVAAVDPVALMDDPRFAEVAEEATRRLQAALDAACQVS